MRSALGARIERLRAVIGGASWVATDNLHITLKFLGRVDQPRLELVEASLARAVAGLAPFELAIEGLGAFPSPSRARVIWAGVSGGVEPLAKLADKVERELAALGFPPEDRGFSAHVTLARIREPRRDPNVVRALEEGASLAFGTMRVDRIALMRSELSPRGVRYTELASRALG